MKLSIENDKLEILLRDKQQYIGKKVALDSLMSAISLLVSVIFASYDNFGIILGKILKAIFFLLAVYFTFRTIKDAVNSRKQNYNFEALLMDIKELNEITHYHSITIIKDTFNEFPNRYLVYEDARWNCDLFFNTKDNTDNEEFIKSRLSSALKISKSDIELIYKTEDTHEKLSETAQKNKLYHHYFYYADLKNIPDNMKSDTFEIDGIVYKWRTIADMEQDEAIRKKNLDIVSIVKTII